MATVSMLLAIAVGTLAYLCYDRYKRSDIFKKVKWCISYDSFDNTEADLNMRNHILRLQHKLSVGESYRITKDESDIIVDILHSFQQDLIQRYFNDSLTSSKYIEEVFFTIALMEFLEKHQCEKTFNGNTMHTMENYKSYGTWGVTSFSATLVLTDYAVTYYKLLYITQLYYNKLHNITDANALGCIKVETTKVAIDTRHIDVNNF